MGYMKIARRRAISEVIGAIFVFMAITIGATVLTYYLTTTIGGTSSAISAGLGSNAKQLDEQLSLTVAGLSSNGGNVTVLIYNTGSTSVNLNKAIVYISTTSGNTEVLPNNTSGDGYTAGFIKCSQGSSPGSLLTGGSCLINITGPSNTFVSSSGLSTVGLVIVTQENNAYYILL